MSATLSRQQQCVLDYARVFFSMNDAMPSANTIARNFGYASANAASEILLRLAKRGAIEKNEQGGYRFVRTDKAGAREMLLRAARYLAPVNDADATLDSDDADAIAAALRILATRIPPS